MRNRVNLSRIRFRNVPPMWDDFLSELQGEAEAVEGAEKGR